MRSDNKKKLGTALEHDAAGSSYSDVHLFVWLLFVFLYALMGMSLYVIWQKTTPV